MYKVIVHAPIPSDGTSFYRAFGPFSHLQRSNPGHIQVINGSIGGFEYDWHTLLDADILFVQRPSTPDMLEIIRVAKRSRKLIWIDYDDDYINIPKTNPRHDIYASPLRKALVKECMLLADIITTSTQPIADSIIDNVGTTALIQIIPNAYDPFLFSPKSMDKNPPRKKTILWRGGDTHEADVDLYKEAMLECFDKYPDYEWTFFGHQFKFMTEHALKKNQDHRIVTYQFMDIMQYFNSLMQVLPELMVVPLADHTFNRGKSNIAWIEGTLAGATVIASQLPEFEGAKGCGLFKTQEELVSLFSKVIEDKSLSEKMYNESVQNIPSLDQVNTQRLNLILNFARTKHRSPVLIKETPWDQQRTFAFDLVSGFTQENESYMKAHHRLADWLIEKYDPKTAIEFGCGPGATLEKLLMSNVESLGVELNDHLIEYFAERNPVFADRVVKADITGDLELDNFDIGLSVEVFEHIDMPKEWWDKFITLLSQKMKHFYFTSTPYRSSVKFDNQWGHVNVRQMESWIDLFERNGWKYAGNPQVICPWDLLFDSKA